MATLPWRKIPKEQMYQLRNRCAELCDQSMDMMLGEVLDQKKDYECTAMLHLLVSQNMGQPLDMYIEPYGREIAEKHFDLILNARLRAAEARNNRQSAFLN